MTSDRDAARRDGPGGTDEETVARLERVSAYVERELATLDHVPPAGFVFTRSLGRAFNKRT